MADDGDADKAKRPAVAEGRARSEENEWTASDRRGPLGEAGSEQEGEAPADAPASHGPQPQGTPQQPSASAEKIGPEPPRADPSPVNSSPAGPSLADPSPADPSPAEPPPVEPAAAEPERRKVPVLSIVAALVVGAVIGAGSAAVVYKSGDQGASQGDVNALASRLDALEKRPDPQPEIDQLKASLVKAPEPKASERKPPEQPAAPAFDPAPLQQKLAALETDIAALKTQSDKVAALDGAVAGLKAQGAEVKSLDDKLAALAGSIDGLKKEDQSAQAGIASLQSGQKALEGRTGAPALAVAADSLVLAIAQGRPYTGQVDALASLGADPAKIAVLRENAGKGVPSAQTLAAGFVPLADPITATASQAPPNASLGDRLKSGLFGMVSIRRADATAGDDPGSRVSRIEADLAHDDVAGAYETWAGLPAAAKAKSEAWGALAKTQVEAMGAARALQQQAIAALGKKS